MTDGLKDVHREAIIAEIAANDRVERAVLFGSRATGTNTVSSDVDIALFGDRLTLADQARLAAALDEIPMAQATDLVLHHLIKCQALRDHIRRQGVEWFARSNTRRSSPAMLPSVSADGVRSSFLCLEDVASITMGQSPRGETVSLRDGVPLLNGPTEFGAHHPHPVQFTTDPRRSAQPGDLLFCVRGSTTGRMNWADRQYAIGRGVAAIRHRQDLGLQPFVRAVIEFELPELLAYATGSTFPNVSGRQLAEVPWPNFANDEQRAIAHILSTLDDKIELNRQMNETLEAMSRALFKSWFVDFNPVRAKMEGRDTGLPDYLANLFPGRLVDSELGKIPEGWQVRTLGNLCHKPQYGYTASAQSEPVGPQFLRITDINKESWVSWSRVPYCKATDDEFSKYRLGKGDVLIARMADPGHGILVEEDVKAVFASYLIRFRPVENHIARLLQYWLKSDAYWHLVQGRATGTTRRNLNAKVLSLFPLVVPSNVAAATFSEVVGALRDRLVMNVTEMEILATLRDTLLPKLVSGEIRVGDAEKALELVP